MSYSVSLSFLLCVILAATLRLEYKVIILADVVVSSVEHSP